MSDIVLVTGASGLCGLPPWRGRALVARGLHVRGGDAAQRQPAETSPKLHCEPVGGRHCATRIP